MWGYPPGWFLPDHSLTKSLSAVFGCSLSLVGSQVVHSPPLEAEFHHLTFLALDWKCSNLMIPMFRNVLNCVSTFWLQENMWTWMLYIYIQIYHIPIKEEFQTFQIPNIAYALHMYCFLPVVPQQLVSLRVCHGFAKHRAGECADTRANWILVSLFGTENTVLAVVFLDVQDQGRNVQNKLQHKGVKNVRCFWHFESWVTNETLD